MGGQSRELSLIPEALRRLLRRCGAGVGLGGWISMSQGKEGENSGQGEPGKQR